jgi:hypothetical protein
MATFPRSLALFAAFSAATLAQPARAQEDDGTQIRQVLRAAFLPTAHIEGMRNGVFTSWTVDQYVAGFRGTPAPDEGTRTRVVDIVDRSGTAAMARATLKHGATTFTDYFLLLKSDGKWLIANKVYHAQR